MVGYKCKGSLEFSNIAIEPEFIYFNISFRIEFMLIFYILVNEGWDEAIGMQFVSIQS